MSNLITVADTFGLTEAGTLADQSPLVRRQYSPQRKKAIAEAERIWDRVWNQGDMRATVYALEAMSSSDLFVSATGDVLDRELMARYNEIETQWASFASRTTVRNFKPKKMVDVLGGRTLLERVPELTEYPQADYDTREYSIKVEKFGRRFGFSWEASVNDDLDELQTVPNQFATAARITEDVNALSLVADPVTGAPNAAFFKNYSGDTIPGPNTTPATGVTAPLTEDNLSAAITAVKTRRDHQGNLVAPGRLILMAGVAQEMTARRILNATEVRVTVGGKTTLEPNWLRGAVDLVIHNRLAGNAWFLLPAPATARPAIAVAFLRGFETPDIRVKADTGNRLGGGALGADEGSFEIDDTQFRVRHVNGGATMDPLHTFASAGA